jgi:hypothetical protein
VLSVGDGIARVRHVDHSVEHMSCIKQACSVCQSPSLCSTQLVGHCWAPAFVTRLPEQLL